MWHLENGSSAVERIQEIWPIRTRIIFRKLSTAQHFNLNLCKTVPGLTYHVIRHTRCIYSRIANWSEINSCAFLVCLAQWSKLFPPLVRHTGVRQTSAIVTARKRHKAQISRRRRTVCEYLGITFIRGSKAEEEKKKREREQGRGSYIYTGCGQRTCEPLS